MKQTIFFTGLLLGLTTGGSPAAAQTNPTGVVTLRAAGITFGVDTAVGGRIVSFTVDGAEQLSGPVVHPKFYGSSLWLSPENKWKGNGLLDAGPYSVGSGNETELQIGSMSDSVRGFAMRKEFILHPQDSSVSINYVLRNIAADTQHVAPWEVTRVPTGGLAFFPSGDSARLAKSTLPVTDISGITWYAYDSSTAHFQKMFQRGAEGWTAYVRNGFVFIKTYPVIGRGPWPAGVDATGTADGGNGGERRSGAAGTATPAPGEENVEIYVNQAKTYMELENQGPYRQLAARTGFLQYNTRWYVRKLPAGIAVRPGNAALVEMVRAVIHSKNNPDSRQSR